MKGDYSYLDKLVKCYNSFDDRPWNRLDVIERYMSYPKDFRFILTVRDPNERFDSAVRYCIKLGLKPPTEEQRPQWVERYLLHNKSCRNFANNYGKKLLEINVIRGKEVGFKIITFLGLKNQNIDFPHINRTK